MTRTLPYLPPLSTPFYWRDEQSGTLPSAVEAYFNTCVGNGPGATAEQVALVAAFCRYFILAPCWEINVRDCPEMLADLVELRERAKTLASVESIRRWCEECMDLGLDPF